MVLASGSGSTLQALLDAGADRQYGARVVAVGADRDGIEALSRAHRAGVPTFVESLAGYCDREEWDHAITDAVAAFRPDLVVLAGFMKLIGPNFLRRFPGRVVNTHPALSPSFPGTSGPADAVAYGVKVSGATLFFVDDGVDTGPIIAQTTVEVLPDDTPQSLHERIKTAEAPMVVDTIGRMLRAGWSLAGRTVRLR